MDVRKKQLNPAKILFVTLCLLDFCFDLFCFYFYFVFFMFMFIFVLFCLCYFCIAFLFLFYLRGGVECLFVLSGESTFFLSLQINKYIRYNNNFLFNLKILFSMWGNLFVNILLRRNFSWCAKQDQVLI